MTDRRRATPRTDAVLADPRLVAAAQRLGDGLVKQAVRRALDRCRTGELAPGDVADAAAAELPAAAARMRRVVNATGVVVHTNLGRAPLSAAAVDAVVLAAGATDVELDLSTGRRARRGRSALEALAAAVPTAPEGTAVHVVNNGAAALALAARGLAQGPRQRVVIARGELVEIGDGFRIPELLESVGVELREVGTTNRVTLADYERAVDDTVALVLKVHPSNFVVRGFTSSVAVAALATLGVPVVHDIGSGLLVPHPRLPDEPDASTSLRAGAALVTASGDKLLGGPQCGLVLGRPDVVERLRRHPLARALRVDKLTLAALEATLAGPVPPVQRALGTSAAALEARAAAIAAALSGTSREEATRAPDVEDGTLEVVSTQGAVGGGGAPELPLPSAAVTLPAELAAPLRLGEPAVVGRVSGGRLLLDLLAVAPEDDATLVTAVHRVIGGAGPAAPARPAG